IDGSPYHARSEKVFTSKKLVLWVFKQFEQQPHDGLNAHVLATFLGAFLDVHGQMNLTDNGDMMLLGDFGGRGTVASDVVLQIVRERHVGLAIEEGPCRARQLEDAFKRARHYRGGNNSRRPY